MEINCHRNSAQQLWAQFKGTEHGTLWGQNVKMVTTKHNSFYSCWVPPQECRCPAVPKRCSVLGNVIVKCLFSHTELPALCTFSDPSVFLNVHTWSYRRFFYFSPMPLADHCSPPTSPQRWKGYECSAKCFSPPASMSDSERNGITAQHSKETTAVLWPRTMAQLKASLY